MDQLPTIKRIFANELVQYECECRSRQPITLTYFCRYCLKLRCRNCVQKEVDSQYCQHCLEYIPIMDGKLKKNKCATCFQCPICFHTLSTRSFLEQNKKAFILVCGFCKWSSLDVGIPKQFVASGAWPEIQIPHAEQIDKRFDYFKAQKTKALKSLNKRPINVIDVLDKYSISTALSPRVNESLRLKLLTQTTARICQSDSQILANQIQSNPSVATDDVEPLDQQLFYDQPIDPFELSSLQQRLYQIELQPRLVSQFFPISKTLSVKRSLRCRQCEHNLIKSECNPCMIRLKIQLSAFYHVPEIKLMDMPVWPKSSVGEEPKWTELIVTIKNPTSYKMKVHFLANDESDEPEVEANERPNVEVQLPSKELLLLPKDETLDLGIDQQEQPDFDDDER